MALNNQPRNFQAWAVIAATPNDFNCDAGLYGVTLHATVWGSAVLNKLMSDGLTYLPVFVFTSDGYQELRLTAGQYQLTLAGITGLTGEIAKIRANAI